MASVLRMSFTSLMTVISLVQIGAALPGSAGLLNYPALYDMISHSIKTAVRELDVRKHLEEQHFHSGNDRKMSEGHLWHHARFMFSGDRGKISQLNDKAYISIRATKELLRISKLPLEVLQSDPKIVAKWRKCIEPHCNCPVPQCNPKDCYRTADGTCNNLKYHTWGASLTPQLRYLPAAYDDGINMPRLFSVTGKHLPSPRVVSNVLHSTGTCHFDEKGHSVLLMTWGQMIDHDFQGTPMNKGFNNSDIMCCSLGEAEADQRGSCFPIKVPMNDPRFRQKCMNFVRSAIAPTQLCDMGVRNPVNQHSSQIDGSLLYGSTQEIQNRLRAGYGGLMKMSKQGLMPPADGNKCMRSNPGEYCFDAGDDRNTVVPTLAVLHTLFVREHNSICGKLHKYNPTWSDEKLFQECRKIVSAILQHINYNEYLPNVLGDAHMRAHGLYSTPKGHHTVYNPKVNPTASNVFGVAAFRFGHSQIPNLQGMRDPHTQVTKTVPIQYTFNRPAMIFDDNGKGCGRMAYWQLNNKQAHQDRFLQDGVRNYLFLDKQGNSFDLAALNIQRGRDHGIAPYNAWRKWCGFKPAFHFGTGPGGLVNHDHESAMLLSKVYKHPDDIDLFTGGLSEMNAQGSLTGPTFACIISKQFQAFKVGDRFWYENDFPAIGFTKGQLNAIKRVSLSQLMCASMGLRQIQPDAFHVPSFRNPLVGCEFLPRIDLRHWIEGGNRQYQPFKGMMFNQQNIVPYNLVPFWTFSSLPNNIAFPAMYNNMKVNFKSDVY
ncbi:peroxidase-like protein [Mizuhopecten yessoensis]|uniref:peroxidase-like protein n=1 Tax=Mizuhopecten yessoensis TaxID=6573 RepID=UPI000B45A766|nr:peroxidase-like protein [Mizuhopecten yessoensis]